MHRYHVCYGQDADYIVWESLVVDRNGVRWIEHTRWMIPNTQLED